MAKPEKITVTQYQNGQIEAQLEYEPKPLLNHVTEVKGKKLSGEAWAVDSYSTTRGRQNRPLASERKLRRLGQLSEATKEKYVQCIQQGNSCEEFQAEITWLKPNEYELTLEQGINTFIYHGSGEFTQLDIVEHALAHDPELSKPKRTKLEQMVEQRKERFRKFFKETYQEDPEQQKAFMLEHSPDLGERLGIELNQLDPADLDILYRSYLIAFFWGQEEEMKYQKGADLIASIEGKVADCDINALWVAELAEIAGIQNHVELLPLPSHATLIVKFKNGSSFFLDNGRYLLAGDHFNYLRGNEISLPIQHVVGLAWVGRAEKLKDAEKYDEALQAYQKASETLPHYSTIHVAKGLIFQKQGKYQAAKAQFFEALEVNERDVDAHHSLANLYSELMEYEKAEPEYQRAIELDPKYFASHLDYGNFLMEREEGRELGEAEQEFLTAIELAPNEAVPHHNLSVLYYEQKKFPEAEAKLRDAVAAEPENPEYHYQLGYLLYKLERFKEAQEEIEETLTLEGAYKQAPDLWLQINYALNEEEAEQESTSNESVE